ncbi:hypothetical protein B0T22DRAFT_125889 [Podospora appendiculata]|uniref:Bromo domain-containing protein n=1 Tax=Podospora appendiculata TaxID=314037 RepID=A0AAE1CBA8_9PEZI|nr:hypothetical protein B0T22DRAFT_125889 [Podospora appendiculata]
MSDEAQPSAVVANGVHGVEKTKHEEAPNGTNGTNAANTPDKPETKGVNEIAEEAGRGSSTVLDDQPFSWLKPHPIYIILLVGPEEVPFGIQRDFLCAKSTFYKQYFTDSPTESLENIVHLRDTPVDVFSYAQNFMYTGQVFPSIEHLPSYEVLIGLWKLGHELGIDGLCDATLEAMTECRRITHHIPATPLLVQVWQDTPDGCSLRKLLLFWAAEYMRSSEARKQFAQSLPQEVLSELVVAMSSLEDTPAAQAAPTPAVSAAAMAQAQAQAQAQLAAPQNRNVHYLEPEEADAAQVGRPIKKQRHSDVHTGAMASATPKPIVKKPGGRVSLPSSKPMPKQRKSSTAFGASHPPSTNQKLNFCSDLLTRMLSGPGFWTRLVGPFKEPVDPVSDGVPDYFDKVTKPMDLGTMKAKMDSGGYTDEAEFLADMNQIFTNCFTYWSKKDAMYGACERLQKTFEEKYSQMNKWIAKMEGDEPN